MPLTPVVEPDVETATSTREYLERMLNEGEDVDLVLHNDDNVYYATVVEALTTVLEFAENEAYHAMMQVHNHGKGVLVTCKEPEAEEYKRQLEAYGLTITID